MIKMYKLVNQDFTTHSGMKWAIGQTNKAKLPGNSMCTGQVLHCYKTPEQAVLFNPIHANIQNPILLEIDCSAIVADDGLKYASKEQTPVKIIPLPTLTINQKVAIAIKLALLTYKASSFVSWATGWLDGSDRTAAAAADAAARATYAAADAAAYATYAAAYAAYAAADAATRAGTDAATYAAYAAADAATYATYALKTNLQEIINWVMENIS